MKKNLVAYIVLAVFALVFSGCGKSEKVTTIEKQNIVFTNTTTYVTHVVTQMPALMQVSPTTPTGAIENGKIGQRIGAVSMTASTDLHNNQIVVEVMQPNQGYVNLKNLYIKYGGVTSPAKDWVQASDWNKTPLVFDAEFDMMKGSSLQIEIFATSDVSQEITFNVAARAKGVTSNGTPYSTNDASCPSITALAPDSTSFSQAPQANTMVTPNTEVVFGTYEFGKPGFSIDSLSFKIFGAHAVDKINVYETENNASRLISSCTINSNGEYETSAIVGVNLPISAGKKTLYATVLIKDSVAGVNVQPQLSSYTLVNSTTGESSSYEPNVQGLWIQVCKSMPVIRGLDLNSTSLKNGKNTGLRMQVEAIGDQMNWKRIIYTFKTSNLIIDSFEVIDETNGVIIPGQFRRMSEDTDFDGSKQFKLVFEARDEVVHLPGIAKNFALNFNVAGVIKISDYVTVSLEQSGTWPYTDDFVSMGELSSFVWSDVPYPTYHSLSTHDWHNEYLIQGLPIQGQTLFN